MEFGEIQLNLGGVQYGKVLGPTLWIWWTGMTPWRRGEVGGHEVEINQYWY
jgi:hypothetical protein